MQLELHDGLEQDGEGLTTKMLYFETFYSQMIKEVWSRKKIELGALN